MRKNSLMLLTTEQEITINLNPKDINDIIKNSTENRINMINYNYSSN